LNQNKLIPKKFSNVLINGRIWAKNMRAFFNLIKMRLFACTSGIGITGKKISIGLDRTRPDAELRPLPMTARTRL
jgi:hypothetical protein